MLYLHHDLKAYFTPGKEFEQCMGLQGTVYRQMDGRTTQRIELGGGSYFVKQHHGVGWKEIFKNLLQLKAPVVSARNEWQAIQALEALQIHVPRLVGYGERGWNPASRQSFILMEDLRETVSLEDLSKDWRQNPPSINLRKKLISEVARIARIMHQHQICHRDFYICHFLLENKSGKIYLIDLHRAQIRKRLSSRWKIKDLAGLYFSSQDIGLSRRDFLRFIKCYRQASLADIFKQEKVFWNEVKERGERLYREHQ